MTLFPQRRFDRDMRPRRRLRARRPVLQGHLRSEPALPDGDRREEQGRLQQVPQKERRSLDGKRVLRS